MRKTGSRESRERRDASATSPISMAVKTFSMRFGSRRNHRPVHQKILSITTVSAIIDTMRIGHIIGPPLWNLSINQLLLKTPHVSVVEDVVGLPPAAGLSVAVTLVAGEVPGASGETPGA